MTGAAAASVKVPDVNLKVINAILHYLLFASQFSAWRCLNNKCVDVKKKQQQQTPPSSSSSSLSSHTQLNNE